MEIYVDLIGLVQKLLYIRLKRGASATHGIHLRDRRPTKRRQVNTV
jgi:hypothetical protein